MMFMMYDVEFLRATVGHDDCRTGYFGENDNFFEDFVNNFEICSLGAGLEDHLNERISLCVESFHCHGGNFRGFCL